MLRGWSIFGYRCPLFLVNFMLSKPIYRIIQEMYPDMPRLDVFGIETRNG
ncbi:MAG: hypothetical protein H6Q57_2359, partial [Geobacteraceae bacterium]|nr:hypothetical protein [Geobacteraceae bacterium]